MDAQNNSSDGGKILLMKIYRMIPVFIVSSAAKLIKATVALVESAGQNKGNEINADQIQVMNILPY